MTRHPGAALVRCAAVVLGLVLWLAGAGPAAALTQQQAYSMAAGDSDARIAALNAAVARADPALAAYVQALLDDEVKVAGERAFILRDGKAVDAATGDAVALPDGAEDVLNNNRMRRELGAAAAAMQLLSPDREERARGIAEELNVQPATVYTHVRNTVQKLGVDTQTQAVALALRYSFLQDA